MAHSNNALILPTVSQALDSDRYSFLDPPAEIRNEVYHAIFTRTRPTLFFKVSEDDLYCNHFAGHISLLRSCRQVYYESASILYSTNTFRFSKAVWKNNQIKVAVRWLSGI